MDAAAPASGGEAKPVAVDARELRQRMLGAFSAHEMAELAATLGVATSGAGAEANAREIVRSYERSGDLDGLLERLRAERPLLEWPVRPSESAAEEPSSPEGAEEPPAPSNEEPAGTKLETPSSRHEARQAAGAPGVDEPAPSAPWPGNEPTAPEAAHRERGLDPRILVLVSGLTVVAALIAFAAGRASTGGNRGAAEATKAVAPQRRPAGPATHAADAIARGLAGVAGACEIPASDDANVLQRAVEQCGPAPLPRPRPAPDAPELAPSAAPAATDDPGPGRYGIPAPTPATRAPTEGTCLRGCAATHAACGGRCGKEPTQGTQYADYQSCLAKCLSSASKCRLACQ